MGKRIRKQVVKDNELTKFLLQHLDRQKIDFPKIKIKTFLDHCDPLKELTKSIQKCTLNPEVPFDKKKKKELKIFNLSLLEELKKDENREDFKFSSSIFNY